LSWRYPHAAAAREPAKTSVSELKRRAAEQDDEADFFLSKVFSGRLTSQRSISEDPEPPGSAMGKGKASAAERGTAHHTFLRFVALERTGSKAALEEEARRLEQEAALGSEEVKLLDFDALAAFWKSDLGRKISANSRYVQRELAFTAAFRPRNWPLSRG